MKKILAVLLVAVMCLGLIAACADDTPVAPPAPPAEDTPAPPPPPDTGDGDEAVTPDGEISSRHQMALDHGLPWDDHMEDWEPMTFTYFVRNPDTPPAADNPVIAIVEYITNTTIEWQFLVGDLETAMGVMLAGGDVADFSWFSEGNTAAIESGHFMPIEDLIDQHAPRLRAHFDPWWEQMRHTDGEIYTAEIFSTPTGEQRIMEHWGTAFWIQKSVLEHFGRAPATLDEYFEFLYEYAQLNPEIDGVPVLPFEIMTEGWRRFTIDNPGMFLDGNANWGGAVNLGGQAPGDPVEASDRWMLETNRKYYETLNYWFHRGLFTAETLTRTFDEYLAAIATGAVLGMSDQLWNFNVGSDPIRAEGRWERTYMPLALTWEGVTPNYLDMREFTGSNGVLIARDISDPIRAIQYMDWLIDENVQRFLSWGIEGVNWFMNADGIIERTQEQRDLQADSRWVTDNMGMIIYNQFPKMQGSFSDGNSTTAGESPTEYFAGLVDYDRELFAMLGIYTQTGLMLAAGDEPRPRPIFYPFWSMPDPEEGSPADLVGNRILEINVDFLSRLVIAPEGQFDSLWEEYVATMSAVDQTPLLDHFNAIG